MRYRFAALAAASVLVLSAGAHAATSTAAPVAGVPGTALVNASSSAASGPQPLRALKSALRSDLKRALASVRKLDLATVEARGFTLKRIRALAAGKESVAATVLRRRQGKTSRVTVARGSRTFARRASATVRLKPTRTGKKLLRRASRITLTVKATFAPRTGRRVSASFKVTLKRKPGSVPSPPIPSPPNPSPLIPPSVRLLYSQTFDGRAPWSGLSTQCAHPVQWRRQNGDGYAHFEVRPGEPTVAGHERCEVSHGGFGKATPPGEYWYRARQRVGAGFSQVRGSDDWVNVLQWHEDEPPPGVSTGPVDGAVFVKRDPAQGMYIEGDHDLLLESGVFDIHAWNDFVVHGVWTDRPNGYLEWWINGVYGGRANGVTSETGGRHFWKGGIERSSSIDTLQSADISSVQIYRAP